MTTTKEEFEDTKGLIRIRISKKNRQHNGQQKKDKQRSTKHTLCINCKVLTRRVSLVEQELLTLPEHLSSPPFCRQTKQRNTA
jgi:hypothetical protein